MASGYKAGDGKSRSVGKAISKRRLSPPWGKILGRKSIERQAYVFGEKLDLGEEHLRLEEYLKMLKLKKHYQSVGGDDEYPPQGIAAPGLHWYQLALAIARDLDDSLKIIDALPPGRTTRRWRGADGIFLVSLVEVWRKRRPKRSISWCLDQVRLNGPALLREMPRRALEARYFEAKRHRATKRAFNKQRSS